MLPPTTSTIPPNSNGQVTQEIKLTNTVQGEKSIMLKLKISYKIGGNTVIFHELVSFIFIYYSFKVIINFSMLYRLTSSPKLPTFLICTKAYLPFLLAFSSFASMYHVVFRTA